MTSTSKWDKNIDALRDFVDKHGSALVPTAHKHEFDSRTVSLGAWVSYLRIKYRGGLISPDKISQLESFPGWSWGPCKPGPLGNPDRDSKMIEMRTNGSSLQTIGDEYGLSRQRVHQILNRLGYTEKVNA